MGNFVTFAVVLKPESVGKAEILPAVSAAVFIDVCQFSWTPGFCAPSYLFFRLRVFCVVRLLQAVRVVVRHPYFVGVLVSVVGDWLQARRALEHLLVTRLQTAVVVRVRLAVVLLTVLALYWEVVLGVAGWVAATLAYVLEFHFFFICWRSCGWARFIYSSLLECEANG